MYDAISPLTPGSIDLDWDAPDRGDTPTGYRVEYRFASGSWLLGATPALTNASLVLDRADALYQFRVCAENSAGTSGWVEATGTTSEPIPETQSAYRLHTSGTTTPTFTATASGVPTGCRRPPQLLMFTACWSDRMPPLLQLEAPDRGVSPYFETASGIATASNGSAPFALRMFVNEP